MSLLFVSVGGKASRAFRTAVVAAASTAVRRVCPISDNNGIRCDERPMLLSGVSYFSTSSPCLRPRRQRVQRSSRFNPSPVPPGVQRSEEDNDAEPNGSSSGGADDGRIRSQAADLWNNASVRPRTQSTHSAHDIASTPGSSSSEPFDPDMPIDEYLAKASLSPWVPCPDPVARRMLDIAKVRRNEDVHYDLGCGDGRVNFHAADTYEVKQSVGIDIDPSLIERAQGRLSKRHPRPHNMNFAVADLLDSPQLWEKMGSEATVITCYFVEEALQKIRPLLEKYCGNRGVRVVTCGYGMQGWSPRWTEVVLGLPVYLYVLRNKEEEPPSIEEMKAAAMSEQVDVDVGHKGAAAKAATIDIAGGGGTWQGKEDKYPEPEDMVDPNERVDFAWDDFDEADELLRKEIEGESDDAQTQ